MSRISSTLLCPIWVATTTGDCAFLLPVATHSHTGARLCREPRPSDALVLALADNSAYPSSLGGYWIIKSVRVNVMHYRGIATKPA